jgi:hypothetical protein
MQIDRVKANYGRTVATNVKFEFIRLDVGMEAIIEPDEDRKKAIRILKKECKDVCEGMIYKELEVMHG